MRTREAILGAMLGAAVLAWAGPVAAEDRAGAEADNTRALVQLSKASEVLYRKISGSVVRVRIDQAGMLLPKELLKEFEEWRQKQGDAGGGAGPAGGAARRRPNAPRGEESAPPPSTTMPARGSGAGGRLAGIKKFLEQKLKDSPDAEMQGRIRTLLARMEAMRGGQTAALGNEMIGVVIDDQGHALVAGWMRENQSGTYHVTAPDGTDMTAKYVGGHIVRGMAVLKLESTGNTVRADLAAERPAGGELLMCVTAHQGGMNWVTAPAAKKGENRFPVAGDGAMYLFNTQGELSAIGMDHMALPMEAIKADIQWIIENNKDIQPRRLGVKYDPVLPEVRKNMPALGNRPAVMVKELVAGSPAEKAGLKKGDIVVSLDGRPIWELPAIQRDLESKTGAVSIGIFRDGKEQTVELQLGE